MKIQINMKVETNSWFDTMFDLVVGSTDVISKIKQQVAEVQYIPFSIQVMFDNLVLEDERRVSDYGIAEGATLHLSVDASKEILIQQLSNLLSTREMSCDELGLLYCYKYGVKANQALKILGCSGRLLDFIQEQKGFSWENGRVALAQNDKKNEAVSGGGDAKSQECLRDGGAEALASKMLEPAGCEASYVVAGTSQTQSTQDLPSNQAYMDLHDQIYSSHFCVKVARVLDEIVRYLSTCAFFEHRSHCERWFCRKRHHYC